MTTQTSLFETEEPKIVICQPKHTFNTQGEARNRAQEPETDEKGSWEPKSPQNTWKGSGKTFELVAAQIAERWGEAEVEKYNPTTNCFTARDWNRLGFKIIKGEKAIKSTTWITSKQKKDEKATGSPEKPSTDAEGKKPRVYPRTVNLFYYKQVEPMSAKFKAYLERKEAARAKKNQEGK